MYVSSPISNALAERQSLPINVYGNAVHVGEAFIGYVERVRELSNGTRVGDLTCPRGIKWSARISGQQGTMRRRSRGRVALL